MFTNLGATIQSAFYQEYVLKLSNYQVAEVLTDSYKSRCMYNGYNNFMIHDLID